MVETTKEVKKRYCRRLGIEIRNLRISINSAYKKVDYHNDLAKNINRQIEALEKEGREQSIMSAAGSLLPGISRVGKLLSGSDAINYSEINRKIREKMDELRLSIREQEYYQNIAENYEQQIQEKESEWNRSGC